MRRGGIEHEPGTRPGRRGEVAGQALALSEPEGRVRERPATSSTGPLTGGARAATSRRTLAAVYTWAAIAFPMSTVEAFPPMSGVRIPLARARSMAATRFAPASGQPR